MKKDNRTVESESARTHHEATLASASSVASAVESFGIERRTLLQALFALTPAMMTTKLSAQQSTNVAPQPYDAAVLPRGIRSRFVENINGIRFHVLEAGYEADRRPLILMLHGFPELAYSWRKVMLPVANAGYHVIAPDVRGYGRSGGADVKYDDDLRPFRTLNKIHDMVALVAAFGYRNVAAVIGHDQGSPLAGWCALARPDIFQSVTMMSAPFGGPPSVPFNTADGPTQAPPPPDTMDRDLAALNPPRKYYQRYYTTREANENLWHPPQGVHDFVRAYYHMKSADWKQNHPGPLQGRTATEWAKMPRYYVMDLNKGMAETVAAEMPSAAEIAANKWLPEAELKVYSGEFGRTGFQGGLNGYRVGAVDGDSQTFAGLTINVPAMFVGGKSDWGVYQSPGAVERLPTVCTKYKGTHLVDGAGHWVQQEQPAEVAKLIIDFLRSNT
jgi:pimeloyl-ACP methyl ester carboxylesterase